MEAHELVLARLLGPQHPLQESLFGLVTPLKFLGRYKSLDLYCWVSGKGAFAYNGVDWEPTHGTDVPWRETAEQLMEVL